MKVGLPPPIAAAIARGREAMERAPAEVREQRLAVCRACPWHRKDPFERCGKCGCPLATRTFPLRATCPDNPPRW